MHQSVVPIIVYLAHGPSLVSCVGKCVYFTQTNDGNMFVIYDVCTKALCYYFGNMLVDDNYRFIIVNRKLYFRPPDMAEDWFFV